LASRAGHKAGDPEVGAAPALIGSIERAVLAVKRGQARTVVTASIMKDVPYRAGFNHPGHIELLGELASRWWDQRCEPVMMIWSPTLAAVPVIIHIPLVDVPGALTQELVYKTGITVAGDLKGAALRPDMRSEEVLVEALVTLANKLG
jgi:4-hydroxythreonine-4-phosphate dehydrogenase